MLQSMHRSQNGLMPPLPGGILTRNQQLNIQQLADLDALCADCKNTDENIVAIYKHLLSQHRPVSCNILYYQQHQLIGFLSTFFFYKDTCEITMMVAPAFRRKSIATHLLNEIIPLIYDQRVKTLIVSTPHTLDNDWLSAKGFDYQNSEYQMQRKSCEPILMTHKSLIVRPATNEDIPILCAIDSTCFPLPLSDSATHFQHLLYNPNYKLFVAQHEQEVIGKAHLSWQQDSARLTDIAILPKAQKRGFGSEIVGHCINYCLSSNQSTIRLDVETNNKDALRLYTRLGFSIINASDFWTIPFEALRIK